MARRESGAALASLGGTFSHFSFEALVRDRSPEAALARFRPLAPSALYRGWMMPPDRHAALYDALAAHGVTLVNTPTQYRHCHYFPESYPVIEPMTPRSVWLPPGVHDLEAIMAVLAPFGDRPVILKDYVKSRKHEWDEACFIPRASDRAMVARIVSRFLELQGEDLAGGLVFREFVDLAQLTTHSKSGMPLSREFRMFFLDCAPFVTERYWEEGDYAGFEPPHQAFARIARHVKSRFFTMDVAQRADGEWMILELGDAQVAGLPDRLDPVEFYSRLARVWEG